MAGYLLNLIFDTQTPANGTGLCQPDNAGGGNSARSKVSFTVPANWPSTLPGQGLQVNANGPDSTWSTPAVDSHSLGCSLGDSIFVRYQPTSNWPSGISLR